MSGDGDGGAEGGGGNVAGGAFESGYAGTLYFAFRDATEARRFAAYSERHNPKTAVIVVNV